MSINWRTVALWAGERLTALAQKLMAAKLQPEPAPKKRTRAKKAR